MYHSALITPAASHSGPARAATPGLFWSCASMEEEANSGERLVAVQQAPGMLFNDDVNGIEQSLQMPSSTKGAPR